jgi:hypothetical protein
MRSEKTTLASRRVYPGASFGWQFQAMRRDKPGGSLFFRQLEIIYVAKLHFRKALKLL